MLEYVQIVAGAHNTFQAFIFITSFTVCVTMLSQLHRLYSVKWKVMINRKTCGSNWLWARYYHRIGLWGLRKMTKSLSQASQPLSWELNLGTPEYEAVVTITSLRLVLSMFLHCKFVAKLAIVAVILSICILKVLSSSMARSSMVYFSTIHDWLSSCLIHHFLNSAVETVSLNNLRVDH